MKIMETFSARLFRCLSHSNGMTLTQLGNLCNFETPYSYSTWILMRYNNERFNHVSKFQLGY